MASTRRTGRGLLMMHGAGSTAAFVARAFPSERSGAQVHCLDDRTGSTRAMAVRLSAEIRRLRGSYDELFVGGVSIGAHAAGLAALDLGELVDGYVFALPGWIGPAPSTSFTAQAALEVQALGPERVLAQLRADPVAASDWVTAELISAWADRATVMEELSAAAVEPAPTAQELALLTRPALVLALADDPVHPLDVARGWAGALVDSHMDLIPRQLPARDRSVFGAQVGTWLERISGPR